MYSTIKIKSISKFSVFDAIGKKTKPSNNLGAQVKRSQNQTIDFSYFFWKHILSRSFLEDFLLQKYRSKQAASISPEDNAVMLGEMNFILQHIEGIKEAISFAEEDTIPAGEDVFFSFQLFQSLLYFINDYFSEDELYIGLKDGVYFKREITKVEDLSENIIFYKDTDFARFFLEPLVKEHVRQQKNALYKFEIFWPNELALVGVMGSMIKQINPTAKIAVDFSGGNEQFDFTQWVDLITSSGKGFFEYYDYFIIDRDFGNGIQSVQDYLEGNIKRSQVKNIIFYEDDQVFYNKIEKDDLTTDIFQDFIHSTYNEKTIQKMVGVNSIFARFLPYKCYWSNCSFCAINSQNKFSYDTEYSYEFFIDKWIEFIKKFDVKSINFKDEAIPPSVIIRFAKKLVDNNMVVNYQFRTRMEKMYNLENCKILAKSGCGYCGCGLESAIDRINEEIAGKGNKGVDIHDKLKIIHNFDQVGISFHNYSIMGFPGESAREAAVTYKFMKDNIINSNFYTCTPNIFGLMKGPKIFAEKEAYGIEVPEEELNNPFCLIFSFTCNGKDRNLPLLHKFVNDLHIAQFLPWLGPSSSQKARDFWDYIDRSYIFYLLKKYYNKNPFYSYKNRNNYIITQDFSVQGETYFEGGKYLQITESKDQIMIYNWVGENIMLYLPLSFIKLLKDYNSEKTLAQNIQLFGLENIAHLEVHIHYCLEHRLLLAK